MKHSLTVICLFLVTSLSAQEERPSWLISLDGTFMAETAYDQTLYNFEVGTTSGVFLYKGLLLGGELRMQFTVGSQYYETVPVLRYYVFFNDRHAAYVGGRAGYGWGWDTDVFNSLPSHRFAWVWGFRGGYLNRLTENVSLDLFLFHNSRLSKVQRGDGAFSAGTNTTQFGLGLGLQVFL